MKKSCETDEIGCLHISCVCTNYKHSHKMQGLSLCIVAADNTFADSSPLRFLREAATATNMVEVPDKAFHMAFIVIITTIMYLIFLRSSILKLFKQMCI